MGKRLCIFGWMIALGALSLVSVGCMNKPKATAAVPAPPPPAPRREAIYFVKGDASLSPGALVKLKTWTETWGTNGSWTLACPPGPDITYGVLENRIRTLRAELEKLGAKAVDTRLAPKEPPKPYDPVYIEWDPVKAPVYKEAFRPPWMVRPSQKVSVASAKKVVKPKPRKVLPTAKPKKSSPSQKSSPVVKPPVVTLALTK